MRRHSPWLLVYGLVIALGAAACRQSGLEEQAQSVRSSENASSDGSCKLDLVGDRADNVFFLLGLRNFQGLVEGSDVVERFYCNEQTVAKLFRGRLEALAVEQGITADVRQQVVQECLTSYHSRILADRLNSCYRYQLTIPSTAPTSVPTLRSSAASLNQGLFYRSGVDRGAPEGGLSDTVFARRRALAYLAGAWARFGHAPDFVFSAYYSDKAEFVAGLLNNLGCRNVRVEHTMGLIPGGTFVHFEPTSEVREWLGKAW
jgi:hypothetical protein